MKRALMVGLIMLMFLGCSDGPTVSGVIVRKSIDGSGTFARFVMTIKAPNGVEYNCVTISVDTYRVASVGDQVTCHPDMPTNSSSGR